MGAAGATLCGSALWAAPRHAVHRRPFATPGAGIPFVDPALQPPPVPAPRVVASLAEERLRRERVATTFFKHPVLDLQTKEQVGEIDLATAIFKQEVRVDILQRVVLWQRAKRRVISRPAKTRSMVSGGGKKPWRQKGTGRARHGSIRSPIWKGGGKAHGPVVRSFAFKLQKKVRRLGLRCALAARFREGMFCIIESEKIPDYKTKVSPRSLATAHGRPPLRGDRCSAAPRRAALTPPAERAGHGGPQEKVGVAVHAGDYGRAGAARPSPRAARGGAAARARAADADSLGGDTPSGDEASRKVLICGARHRLMRTSSGRLATSRSSTFSLPSAPTCNPAPPRRGSRLQCRARTGVRLCVIIECMTGCMFVQFLRVSVQVMDILKHRYLVLTRDAGNAPPRMRQRPAPLVSRRCLPRVIPTSASGG